MPIRKAEAEWKGNLVDGAGRLKVGSGTFEGPYSGSVANRENGESRACVHAGSYAAMPKIVWINWRCATGSPLANQRT